jgi:molecular chaperone DnaK
LQTFVGTAQQKPGKFAGFAVDDVNEDGRPEIIEIEGEKAMPSVVLYNEDGTITIGEQALRQAVVKSHRVVQWIKRSMGEPGYTRLIQDEEPTENDTAVDEGGQPIEPKGTRYTPQQISAEILKRLVAEARAELGVPVKKAIITCPAWFTDLPRKATQEAGELAGLKVLKIVNEPTAASIYYGLDKLNDGDVIVVYDLGGGTFDCSVIEYKDGEIKHLASDGDRNLGAACAACPKFSPRSLEKSP